MTAVLASYHIAVMTVPVAHPVRYYQSALQHIQTLPPILFHLAIYSPAGQCDDAMVRELRTCGRPQPPQPGQRLVRLLPTYDASIK